ncbi:uncharacterized protein LOC126373347 [Pectinophora gossypiella]|uniref:Tetraspanin n=1 Tax=Pectinophora gossypiella TaxID=13191 RepID=A0A1E1WF70_PECGO|nr:uncharacterized protein LOC126373347 [Pectinophora gossypiella]
MKCVSSFLFDCGDFFFIRSLFVSPILLLTICALNFEAFTKTPVLPSVLITIPIVLLFLIPIRFALGCFGWKAEELAAEKNNRNPIIVFITLLGIIISVLTRFIVLTARSDFPYHVEKWVADGFTEDRMDSFYLLEKNRKCCGTTGADSYIAKNWSIPLTCCKEKLNNAKDKKSSDSDEDGSFTDNVSDAIEGFIDRTDSKLDNAMTDVEYKVVNDSFCTADNAFDGCNMVLVKYMFTLARLNIGFTSVIILFDLITILFAVFVIYELKAKEPPADPNTDDNIIEKVPVPHQLEEQFKY